MQRIALLMLLYSAIVINTTHPMFNIKKLLCLPYTQESIDEESNTKNTHYAANLCDLPEEMVVRITEMTAIDTSKDTDTLSEINTLIPDKSVNNTQLFQSLNRITYIRLSSTNKRLYGYIKPLLENNKEPILILPSVITQLFNKYFDLTIYGKQITPFVTFFDKYPDVLRFVTLTPDTQSNYKKYVIYESRGEEEITRKK